MIEILKNDYEIEKFLEKLSSRPYREEEKIEPVVREIVEKVKENGDKALVEYTKKFDKVYLSPEELRVKSSDIRSAYKQVDKEFIDSLNRVKHRLEKFHNQKSVNSWTLYEEDSITGEIVSPIESVGIYVPGGKALYPSTVLMSAIPAKVAGVSRIVIVTPPPGNPYILMAANEAGISEIYRVGGAQAIAALAFGTETIPKVDKIVGPGNIYVSMAKRLVYGYVDIDMIAGPSEILIISDESASPSFLASDLLSQAEHDSTASAILITTLEKIALEVKEEIKNKISLLKRKDIILEALNTNSAIIYVTDIGKAVEIANRIAPEHLEIVCKEPFSLINKIKNAGTIFIGSFSPEVVGDYVAGPSHILPTQGTARFFSPLSTRDFVKTTNLIYFTREGLRKFRKDIVKFAEIEKLDAHRLSIEERFK